MMVRDIPECSLSQLPLQLVVGYARASLVRPLRSLVVEGESARGGALRRPLEDTVHGGAEIVV
jgi:hypothetical protein